MKLKLSLRRFRRHVRAECPWLPPAAAGMTPTFGIAHRVAHGIDCAIVGAHEAVCQ
jgi:hypothetical protein